MINIFRRKKTYLIKVVAIDLITSMEETWVMDNVAFNNWVITNNTVCDYEVVSTERIKG